MGEQLSQISHLIGRLAQEAEAKEKAEIALREGLDALRPHEQTPLALRALLIKARAAGLSETILEEFYKKMKAKQIGNLRAYVWFAQQSKDLTYPAAAWQIAQLLGTGFSYEGGVEANAWLTEHMARHNTVRILNGTFSGDRFARGALGTHLWRKNPQWGVIRKQPGEDEGEAVVASGGVIKVTARVVASGGSLATLALHAVCNEKSDAADAGCPWLLMPSFRVLGGSDLADEMSVIEFELPANSAAFIVPSVHSGEEGAYTLVVSANEPIDIFELGDE